jgi:hypothetical protein
MLSDGQSFGLSKLKDKRENHKLIQLFKMQNDLTLASLSTLIPNRFQDVHMIIITSIFTFSKLLNKYIV